MILTAFAVVVLLCTGALLGVCGTLLAVNWKENRDGIRTWQLIRQLHRSTRRLQRAIDNETTDEIRKENRE